VKLLTDSQWWQDLLHKFNGARLIDGVPIQLYDLSALLDLVLDLSCERIPRRETRLRVDVEHNSLLQCIESLSLASAHEGRIYLFIYFDAQCSALQACLSLRIRLPLRYRTQDGVCRVPTPEGN